MPAAKNEIRKSGIATLGYEFVAPKYLPKGKDEYYLRNLQNHNGIRYRQLTAYEIEVLVRNRNTSENWNKLLVSDAFNPELVKNCKFYGLVRIGKLEPLCLEFSDLKVPVGLYNSTIISCDFGDNVVIDNVNYLSHYIVGTDVIVVNVNELTTSDNAKFGNGIIKEGEEESLRIWLELCNENGGRKIIPFNGMLAGDAFLWTKFRFETAICEKLKQFTEDKFDKKRGYYGKIGDRTVIKNCRIIKNVWIGSDAYIKGANKLKNLTINSGPEGKSQIGEGCEIVNGVVDYGCRIFYGVKAVRFIMASHSQLKYGARLINSYLGNNSTISCCEVLNSLIFPGHEQHHNNSFLTAATLLGLSNIAAGATIGSNHNSRSADGELQAGRGFWPGLCVSLKHNSKFASFTILAKGDYPAELNIPIPFALVSNDVTQNRLIVMPAYWFLHNMYALERNSWKYIDRDKRQEKVQHLEYNYLAPDSIGEMVTAVRLLQKFTGKAWLKKEAADQEFSETELIAKGKQLLEEKDPEVNELEILADGFENSKRKVVIIKALQSYHQFKDLISFYCINQLLEVAKEKQVTGFEATISLLPAKVVLNEWLNVGGQLIPRSEVDLLMQKVRSGKVKSWETVHQFYRQQAGLYSRQKLAHALAALIEVSGVQVKKLNKKAFNEWLSKAIATKESLTERIFASRAKDYNNPFRKMSFESQEEMDAVVGKLEDNSFIKQQREALEKYKLDIEKLMSETSI